jgi:hypothetical protein
MSRIYSIDSVLKNAKELEKQGFTKHSLGMGDLVENFVLEAPAGYQSIIFTEAYTSERGTGYGIRKVNEISASMRKKIDAAKNTKELSLAEKQKKEAIARMKLLRIIPDAIEQFRKGDVVMKSEAPFGALYWLSDDEKEMVSEFEKKFDAKVYMVVRANTSMGLMDSLLYVGKDEDEWIYDRDDLEYEGDKYPMSYTVNHEDDWCSEFGRVGVKPMFGGLIRTA